VAAAAQ
jgi:hypothetical protein